MYNPPPPVGGVQTLAAADPTITVGGTPTARNVKVAKQLDSSYLTDFAAAVAAQLAQLTSKNEVAYATAAALPANTYANGAAGVGATLTANANGALTVDGQAVVVGQRIFVKNEAATTHNGIYVVTATGGAGAPYVLTRAADFDQPAEVSSGDVIPVAGPPASPGAANDGTIWVTVAPTPFVFGTSALTATKVGGGAVALTSDAKSLAADTGNIGALTTFLTSNTLAVGTWAVICGAELHENSAGISQAIKMEAGTATATFVGCQAASWEVGTALAGEPAHLTIACIVTVTVAGTILFRAMFSGGQGIVRASSEEGAYPNATGYIAVKLA